MISLDIKPQNPLHKRILDAVCARKRLSQREMQKRHAAWDKADEEQVAYIPEKDTDALRRAERGVGEPQFTTLQIPYAYGLLMSAHTYWSSVFLARSPVLQFAGRHGEAEMNVQAVEALMDYQTHVGGHMVPYYIWLFDAGKYGLGVIGRYWAEESNTYSQIVDEPVTVAGISVGTMTRKKKIISTVKGYHGNRLFNVRPKDWLPDPRVPLSLQKNGEFNGRLVDLSLTTLLRRQRTGQYINIEEVRKNMKSFRSERMDVGAGDHWLPDTSGDGGGSYPGPAGVTALAPAVEMVIDLVPDEWGLGSTGYPEKWVFTTVDDKHVIEAHPLGEAADEFPFQVLECEIEGYSVHKRGLLDVARPLNFTLEWLINTHFYNVRKSLNGEIAFDPSRISAKDMLEGKPGKRIKVKPTGYGQDIRTMIHTFGADTAVTGTHMRDAAGMIDMMQMALGVNDTVAGQVNPGGRKSATEIRASTSSSVSRQKTICEYFSAMGFAPLSQGLLQSTQQNYTGEMKYRIVGDMAGTQEIFLPVSPEKIAGFYDYIPVDGTLPLDRFALVNMWANLMSQMQRFPQVMQTYDFGKIFAWVAQLGGLKNIKQFKVQMMPPGVLPGQAQAGNVIPLGGPNAGTPGRAAAATRGGTPDTPRIPGANQIPGMGESG